MKNYIKHILCLSVIFSAVFVFSCKKDESKKLPTTTPDNTTVSHDSTRHAARADFRDSIVGVYFCSTFHESSSSMPGGGSASTTFTFVSSDSIHIIKDLSDSGIIVQGTHFALDHQNSYAYYYGDGGLLSLFPHLDSVERYFNITESDHYTYELDHYTGRKAY